ncbi:MAG TPA: cytochrome ubiquinol oxidase subunit I [Bacteroidota bacterium]
MDLALLIDRIQFGFTISFHYLFPQLTMGLALLIVILKWLAVRRGNEFYNAAARFWARIFAINFFVGVITGIPMEFQFGTNWARFSVFAGGVIGQTLAMEGVFAFFLESSFLGLFLFGERRLGPRGHLLAAVMVWLGAWVSGYFITATNAWMQHPVAYATGPDGSVNLVSLWGLLTNPWLGWQYLHTMGGAVITAGFVMAAVGAYYLLAGRHGEYGLLFVRTGIAGAFVAMWFVVLPSGDLQGRNLVEKQPVTLAAMEGVFKTKQGVELILIGQPDVERMLIDNPVHIPNLLSFLTYRRWEAEIKGLEAFPREDWPDNIPLLYYAYHIMVGLGTIFMAAALFAIYLLWKKRLASTRPFLWVLLLMFPFPYISNTAGWMTAELGRQPWLVYNLLRTAQGTSHLVSSGNSIFTLLGFLGMYFIIGVLFILLVLRQIGAGPAAAAH